MIGFEENEISINANGGTELAKRKLANLIDPELLSNFQIVSSRVRELDESKIRIFWAHDLAEDPESKKFQDQSFKNSFHKFVYISDWQYQRYQLVHGIPYDDNDKNDFIVIKSGCNATDFLGFIYSNINALLVILCTQIGQLL